MLLGASSTNPTSAKVNRAKKLAEFLDVAYGIDTIGGHREFAITEPTLCPGEALTEEISPIYKIINGE